MKQHHKALEERPELKDDEQFMMLLEQADGLHGIKTLMDNDGGKQLVKLLSKDVVNGVYALRGKYKNATHTELVALVALLDSRIDLLRLLLNAKDSLSVVNEEIESALRE